MNRLHPNQCPALAMTALVVAISASGCRGQQTAMSNPFLAPDRVPPPATRSIAPGTAQPYYPGDPLPATQSATAAANPGIVATNPPLTSAATHLDAVPSSRVASSGEPGVGIPVDDNELRFALPPSTAPQVAAAPATAPSAPQVAAAPPHVMATVYNGPDPYQATPDYAAGDSNSGPWRAPRLPHEQPQNFAALGPQPSPMPTIPPEAPQPSPELASHAMPVSLRVVPSPAIESIGALPPRIRFPGAVASMNPASADALGTVEPASFLTPVTGSVVQTVQVTELPPAGFSAAAPLPATSSPDGFRPRGSLR